MPAAMSAAIVLVGALVLPRLAALGDSRGVDAIERLSFPQPGFPPPAEKASMLGWMARGLHAAGRPAAARVRIEEAMAAVEDLPVALDDGNTRFGRYVLLTGHAAAVGATDLLDTMLSRLESLVASFPGGALEAAAQLHEVRRQLAGR